MVKGQCLEKPGEFLIGKGWGLGQPRLCLFGGTIGRRVSGRKWEEGGSKERGPEEKQGVLIGKWVGGDRGGR